MQWYYSKNGTQSGPVGEGELRSMVVSGELSPADMVWREGMTDWLPFSKVAEFASSIPTLSPPVSPRLTEDSPYQPPVNRSTSAGPNIPTYLWQSIVVTFLCCLPFGIVSIVYAAKVDGLKMNGNIQGALEASGNAKKWCNIAVLSGLGIWVLSILLSVLGALGSR